MLSAWEKLLFRVQGEFSVQCFGGDAEQLGRLSLVAAGGAERAFDGLTFGFGQRHGRKIAKAHRRRLSGNTAEDLLR